VRVFAVVGNFLTVMTIAFLLMLRGRDYVGMALRLTGKQEQRYRNLVLQINQAVASYMLGNVAISVLCTAASWIVLMLLGVPYALSLAIVMGFLDLIPLVGATLGAMLVGIATATVDFPTATIVWVIFSIVYQRIENDMIQPVVYGRALSVNPLVTIISVLVGARLLGILGALLAIPIAAAIQILLRDWWSNRSAEASSATMEGARWTPNPPNSHAATSTGGGAGGPYLSERAWGTVREDYSADGDAWSFFPHDHARSRAYRWSEDGLGGICDERQLLCLAFAFWNGRDPFLKERIFGLNGQEGNHGEDAKEYWWYLDSTPTHSWMRWRYVYPQDEFPTRSSSTRTHVAVAARLLRSAGCVPPEVALLQEIDSLKQSIERCTDPEKRSRLRDQLQARQVEFNMHLEERHRSARLGQ